MAFDALDDDESGQLDQDEMSKIMREVAHDLQLKPPTDADISGILAELDEDNDGLLDKEEFSQLIIMVFEKMLDNEHELMESVGERNRINALK